MSNGYFQFKQFRVEQGNCAMKVTTDACIAGAWAQIPSSGARILDIGTGTGLLALMLAQKAPGWHIDALELDQTAVGQANENVAAAQCTHRITVIKGDVRTYNVDSQYDMIITNPPFFNNSLLSDNKNRNAARHTVSLTYDDLAAAADRLGTAKCEMTVLLPAVEFDLLVPIMAAQGWYAHRQLCIRHTAASPVKRIVGVFSKTGAATPVISYLDIYSCQNVYSPAFAALLAPYYLNL